MTFLLVNGMGKSTSELITERRRELQNPYAFLDDLGNFSGLARLGEPSKLGDQITRSRQLLQDPYAYLDESGNFSAVSIGSNGPLDTPSAMSRKVLRNQSPRRIGTQGKQRYSNTQIEQHARSLQIRMWKDRNQIWPGAEQVNPIDIVDPFVALRYIGYDCDYEETLGQFHSGSKLVEVAGTIENHSKQVRISRKFSAGICGFTAAHELGHALLHESVGLHRDRPLDGSIVSRDAVEFEADRFAAYFLMPEKLVRKTFAKLFLTDQFSLYEETIFALGLGDFAAQKRRFNTLRHLSRLLASVECYNGHRFISLASRFRVSTEAMAIRLEELELLEI